MKSVLEVPRRISTHLVRLTVGGMLVACGWLLWRNVKPELGEAYRWAMTGLFVSIGALKVLNNLWMIVRRPPTLRASSEGVWFGGGPMLPWHEIELVYQPCAFWSRAQSLAPQQVAFSFYRANTLFRLPPRLWLTTRALGDVAVSVLGANEDSTMVIAQLEALRGDARGGGGELPRARLRT